MPMFIGPMPFVAFPFKGCRTGAANYIFYADISRFLLRASFSFFFFLLGRAI
jgi:hypothetical protein